MTPQHPLLFSLSVNRLWKRAVNWGKCRCCTQLTIGEQDGCDPPHKRCTRHTPACKYTQTTYAHGAAINSCSENYFWENFWKTALLARYSIVNCSIYHPIHYKHWGAVRFHTFTEYAWWVTLWITAWWNKRCCSLLGTFLCTSRYKYIPTLRTMLFWVVTQRVVVISRTKSLDSRNLKMGPIGCPETSVRNYHYSLRNNPEKRSSHLLSGGSLKSGKCLQYLMVLSVTICKFCNRVTD